MAYLQIFISKLLGIGSQRIYKVHQGILGWLKRIYQADFQRRKMRVFNSKLMKQKAHTPPPPLCYQGTFEKKLFREIFGDNCRTAISSPTSR